MSERQCEDAKRRVLYGRTHGSRLANHAAGSAAKEKAVLDASVPGSWDGKEAKLGTRRLVWRPDGAGERTGPV